MPEGKYPILQDVSRKGRGKPEMSQEKEGPGKDSPISYHQEDTSLRHHERIREHLDSPIYEG